MVTSRALGAFYSMGLVQGADATIRQWLARERGANNFDDGYV